MSNTYKVTFTLSNHRNILIQADGYWIEYGGTLTFYKIDNNNDKQQKFLSFSRHHWAAIEKQDETQPDNKI